MLEFVLVSNSHGASNFLKYDSELAYESGFNMFIFWSLDFLLMIN